MAQVDSESTTAMPARPAGVISPAGLARQQRQREKALRRLAKLRRKASDEIDRLIAFLDASDPYAANEFEQQVDDEPCDTDELELSWVGVNASATVHTLPWDDECEADYSGRESDYEPSLGSHEIRDGGAVSYLPSICFGHLDMEGDEHDGREPDFCSIAGRMGVP
jgi:hypothetical protein